MLSELETDAPIFFLDHNIGGKTVLAGVRAAGMNCRALKEEFAIDVTDEIWLTEVGRRGWFVLTKDYRIAYRVNEISALQNAKVGAFVLSSDNLNGAQIICAILDAWPQMTYFAQHHPRPFIAKFYRDGRVAAWK